MCIFRLRAQNDYQVPEKRKGLVGNVSPTTYVVTSLSLLLDFASTE